MSAKRRLYSPGPYIEMYVNRKLFEHLEVLTLVSLATWTGRER